MTGSGPPPRVILDLQAAQSATYRERGVARYAVDFAKAVAEHPADVLDQVLIREDLLPIGRIERLVASGVVTNRPDWSVRSGGVFHALSPFDLDVPLSLVWPRPSFSHRWPFVVTVYDLIPAKFDDIYLTDPGTRRRYQVRCETIRAADHIMTLSQAVAEDVHEMLGVPRHRISVVGAACAPDFTPSDDQARAQAQARALVPGLGERTVVYNGAIEPRKNMERLVAAFAGLPADTRAGVQLVLVCRMEPSHRRHYEHVARSLGLGDQLLLTGEISDEALIALYRTAELVVYPSIAEGYGLPVAEAMACGAPAVASGNSCLAELVAPDAIFDPFSQEAIAAAVARPLNDPGFRRHLVEWSARPRTTWSDIAERAVEVYARVASASTSATRPTIGSAPRVRRPRTIAIVTPLSPPTSGIAVYSSRLVEELSHYAEVDVFVDGDAEIGVAAFDGAVFLHPASAFASVEAARCGYDTVLMCIGNNEHCSAGLRLIRQGGLEPVTLLHDIRLTNLYRHGVWRDAVPEGLERALGTMYGRLPPGVVEDEWIRPEVAERYGILMAREVIAKSRLVVVTSEFAARLARTDARPEDWNKIFVVPHAYPPAAAVTPEREEGLIGSFGIVNPVKRPLLLVQALDVLRRRGRGVRLVFGGPVSEHDREQVMAEAVRLGMESHIEVTGALDDAGYTSLMARVTVAVQLRDRTNGEASGAVHDCIASGVPLVVTRLGAARELPDFVEKVRPEASADELATQLEALLADGLRRQAISEAGLAYARDHGFSEAAEMILAVADPALLGPSRD